jgi:hypothetical protein
MENAQAAVIGRLAMTFCIALSTVVGVFPAVGYGQNAPEAKKGIGMRCGTCPEGYATTGVTESPEICKDGDPTLVQCVPLGANILAVCGSCPENYDEIGGSSVPARCGSKDGGRMTQCQLRKMEMNLPDPSQGMKTCPPDCGNMGTPGQGTLPPPPRYQQAPESK